MKRALFPLLALAFCLSACTPAASPTQESEAPAVATAEAAVEGETAKESEDGGMVVGTLCNIEDCSNTGQALYVWHAEAQPGDAPALGYLAEVDYATASQRRLLDTGTPTYQLGSCFGRGNKVYYTVYGDKDRTLHMVDLATGVEQTLPVQNYTAGFMDDRALYLFLANNNLYEAMQRVDPATGAAEIIRLPEQTIQICDGDGERFLITRLISSVPLSTLQDEEQLDAALQTSSAEYAWWDPADGSLEPLFREPYFGALAETGQRQTRVYLGKAGGQFYFYRADRTDISYTNCRVERCAPDGSGAETVCTMADGQGLPGVYRQEGQIRWLVWENGNGILVYQTGDGSTRQVETTTGVNIIWPRALTDDGRVLLFNPDSADRKTPSYCLVGQQDYLAGNFTGTDVVPAEE